MVIRHSVVWISSNPLISEAITVNVLAGIAGSTSDSRSIALNTICGTYWQLAEAVGIDSEILHIAASMASGGFDAPSYNGVVITLLAITILTHAKSFFYIFLVAGLRPVAALVTVVVLGTLFGTF
ncbi:MAG: hypothetical protein H6905_09600 [Hyphomicrobiales bacterium]|nr:hypothetical protein [Hyphomicrobiales bacterium]